jgi:hypothetical protein
MKVFDSLGHEVTNLVSEEMRPGTYTRQWNAEGKPSGTYFIVWRQDRLPKRKNSFSLNRLTAANRTQTLTIVFLKQL